MRTAPQVDSPEVWCSRDTEVGAGTAAGCSACILDEVKAHVQLASLLPGGVRAGLRTLCEMRDGRPRFKILCSKLLLSRGMLAWSVLRKIERIELY